MIIKPKRCLNCNRKLVLDTVTHRYRHAAFTVKRKNGHTLEIASLFACMVPTRYMTTGMLIDDSVYYRNHKNESDPQVYGTHEGARWHPTIQ